MNFNIVEFKKFVKVLESLSNQGNSNEMLFELLLSYLYELAEGNLLELFIKIDTIDKEARKHKETTLYSGLQDAMHAMSSFSKGGTKKFNTINKLFFEDGSSSIGSIIRIAMAYFPRGTSDSSSELGHYFFDKFLKALIDNKDYFLSREGKDWAKAYNYYEYIKLVLNKNDKNYEIS